jgi:hypothetical protein
MDIKKNILRESFIILSILFLTQTHLVLGYQKEMYGENNGVSVRFIFDEEDMFNRGKFIIANRSSFPIELNPVADKFYYITKSDAFYLMPTYDYDMVALNPHRYMEIVIDLPVRDYAKFIQKYNEGDIKGISAVINYRKTIIVLTPIKTELEKSWEAARQKAQEEAKEEKVKRKSGKYLDGIYSSGGKVSVMINGELYHCGDAIGDMKIIKIGSGSIVIEVNGETKKIEVGEKLD